MASKLIRLTLQNTVDPRDMAWDKVHHVSESDQAIARKASSQYQETFLATVQEPHLNRIIST